MAQEVHKSSIKQIFTSKMLINGLNDNERYNTYYYSTISDEYYRDPTVKKKQRWKPTKLEKIFAYMKPSKAPITLSDLNKLYTLVGPQTAQLIKNRLYHNYDKSNEIN